MGFTSVIPSQVRVPLSFMMMMLDTLKVTPVSSSLVDFLVRSRLNNKDIAKMLNGYS